MAQRLPVRREVVSSIPHSSPKQNKTKKQTDKQRNKSYTGWGLEMHHPQNLCVCSSCWWSSRPVVFTELNLQSMLLPRDWWIQPQLPSCSHLIFLVISPSLRLPRDPSKSSRWHKLRCDQKSLLMYTKRHSYCSGNSMVLGVLCKELGQGSKVSCHNPWMCNILKAKQGTGNRGLYSGMCNRLVGSKALFIY